MLTYKPSIGEHIDQTIELSIALAVSKEAPVQFTHNGVTLTVTANSLSQDVLNQWQTILDAKAEAYRTSPEGISAAESRLQWQKENQQKTNRLMGQLHTRMHQDAVVEWVGEFAQYSDDTRISYDKQRVIDVLEGAGYQANAYCGNEFVKNDRNVFAAWLIGQVLDGLKGSVGAIHPIAAKFADGYKNWNAQEAINNGNS